MIHSSSIGTFANIAEKKALKLADVLTTDSKTVQKSYKEKFNVDFIYLPAPLDAQKFKTISSVKKNHDQIVYVGRDSYEKGIDILKNIEPKINGKVVYCTDFPWKKTKEPYKIFHNFFLLGK